MTLHSDWLKIDTCSSQVLFVVSCVLHISANNRPEVESEAREAAGKIFQFLGTLSMDGGGV